jgi:hypothetical protein
MKEREDLHAVVHQPFFEVLANWAAPHIQTRMMRPVSPAGLYAIILAPMEASFWLPFAGSANRPLNQEKQRIGRPC